MRCKYHDSSSVRFNARSCGSGIAWISLIIRSFKVGAHAAVDLDNSIALDKLSGHAAYLVSSFRPSSALMTSILLHKHVGFRR